MTIKSILATLVLCLGITTNLPLVHWVGAEEEFVDRSWLREEFKVEYGAFHRAAAGTYNVSIMRTVTGFNSSHISIDEKRIIVAASAETRTPLDLDPETKSVINYKTREMYVRKGVDLVYVGRTYYWIDPSVNLGTEIEILKEKFTVAQAAKLMIAGEERNVLLLSRRGEGEAANYFFDRSSGLELRYEYYFTKFSYTEQLSSVTVGGRAAPIMYVDPSKQFKIQPPKEWNMDEGKTENESYVVRFEKRSSLGWLTAFLEISKLRSRASSWPEIIESFRRAVSNHTIQSDRPIKVARETAHEFDYRIPLRGLRSKTIIVPDGDITFVARYLAVESQYSQHIAEVDKSLQSLRFLKNIFLDANPRVGSITVNETTYSNLPVSLSLEVGETYEIYLNRTLTSNHWSRYVFKNWSDGYTDNSRKIRVASNLNLTALYSTEYFLKVLSDFGGPQGEGFKPTGSLAEFSVDRQVPLDWPLGPMGFGMKFSHWTGNFSGNEIQGRIVMDGPKIVMANWNFYYPEEYNPLAVIIAASIASVFLYRYYKQRAILRRQLNHNSE